MPPRNAVNEGELQEQETGDRISGEHRIDGAADHDVVDASREYWRSKIEAAYQSLRRDEEISRQKISMRYPGQKVEAAE